MLDFFSFFRSKKQSSKNAAKERLQLVLIHDRAGMSPELLEQLKGEILNVLAKYIEIEEGEFDISLTTTKSEDGMRSLPALVANIPINKMKK